MKYCKHCDVNVNTNKKVCPLCFSVLEEDNKPPVGFQSYPHKTKKHKMKLVDKILIYASLIAIVVSLFINFKYLDANHPVYWSLIVTAGIPYLWIIIKYIILSKDRWDNKIFFGTIYTVVYLFIVDLVVCLIKGDLSSMWSISYVIPLFVMLITILNFILGLIIKPLYVDSITNLWSFTLLLLIYNLLISLVFKKYYISWIIDFSYLLIISINIAMFIFKFKDTLEEFKKRFHIQ